MNEIRLHSRIYRRKNIEAAAEAFSEIASFGITRRGAYYHVGLSPRDPASPDNANIQDEFCNYLVYLAKRGTIS
ncbi:MAG: HxsD-like protein [bacterium]